MPGTAKKYWIRRLLRLRLQVPSHEESPGDVAAGAVRIDITNLGLPGVAREACERRVLLALSRFGPQLPRLAVALTETRNPLGGVDRRCRITARLRDGGDVRGEAVDETFESAVARAAIQLAQRLDARLRDTRAGEAVDPPARRRRGPASR
jgi:hypothetical protein